MLRIEHLDCGYGAVRGVHDVSFDVPDASIFALLGPNGAGKTSTIMAIMGRQHLRRPHPAQCHGHNATPSG